MELSAELIPLWTKIAYTIVVLVVVSVYLFHYPLGNLLWFSDIAFIAIAVALWLESALLASMMAVGTLLPELLWNVSFFGQLLTGRRVSGLTDYMFDSRQPLYVRALSLFHVILPFVTVWLVARLGYDARALLAQTFLAWIVLILSYRFTDPKENVNWVFGFGAKPQRRIPPLAHLMILLAGFPLVIHLPTHLLLQHLFH